jgi:hypothetical protein
VTQLFFKKHQKNKKHIIGKSQTIAAVSDILGENKFLMGNDRPCTEDCSLFGFISSMLYNCPDDNFYKIEVKKNYKNLIAHNLRMREMYWPDWDEMKYKK